MPFDSTGEKNKEKLTKMKFTEESLEIRYSHQSSILNPQPRITPSENKILISSPKSITMILRFKIKLLNVVDPEVWRQILVPSQITFHQFHQIIQEAFGWKDSHLYDFCLKGRRGGLSIGLSDFGGGEDVTDSDEVLLSEMFIKPRQKMMYNYDFGDGWKHEITLEKLTDSDSIITDCIGGKGTCPPEDCGGPFGYWDLKKTLSDPKNPKYKEMCEWFGLAKKDKWDSDNFDLRQASKTLRRFSAEYL